MMVKQNSFQTTLVFRRSCVVFVALWTLCTTVREGQAQGELKGFGDTSALVRLTGERRLDAGTYRSAIVITMPSGSHTYWKQPGDAGVPPVFAFDGSSNVARSQVLYPVPTRIKEEGLEAFGYVDRVAFPILVTPRDAGKPSVLRLTLNYAVCNRICMPGHAAAELRLPVSGQADDETVAAAFAAVPAPLPSSLAGQLTLAPVVGAPKPSWTVAWSGSPPIHDLFADAPEGYAFDTRAGARPGTWTLVASEALADPKNAHVPLALTLAGATQSFEVVRTLDLPAAMP